MKKKPTIRKRIAKTPTRTSRRRAKHHSGYIAEVRCEDPQERFHYKTILTRRLRISGDDSAGLIAAAAALRPGSTPTQIDIASTRTEDGSVIVKFDDNHFAIVWLDMRALRMMAMYLVTHTPNLSGVLMFPAPPVSSVDDDGGEELPVPTISQAAAANMRVM